MLFFCDVPVDLSRVSMELADVSGSLTIVVLDLISDTAVDVLYPGQLRTSARSTEKTYPVLA